MYAVRFQHGSLSRGGRRRSSPPGNARAEGFTSFAARVLQNKRSVGKAAARIHKPPDGGFLLTVRSGRVARRGAKHADREYGAAVKDQERGGSATSHKKPLHLILPIASLDKAMR